MDITVKDNKLYFGDKQVHTEQPVESTEYVKEQPLYCIRVPDGNGYANFVCGLDVLDDGNFWLGGIFLSRATSKPENLIPETIHRKFETIQHILNLLCVHTKGKEWFICEDPKPEETW
jgi:hypothetical protein